MVKPGIVARKHNYRLVTIRQFICSIWEYYTTVYLITMFGFIAMNEYPRLIINTKGLKKDKFYIGGLIVFWLIWTPITLFFCIGAIVDFHWFLLIWLPFGLAGVILIPIKLYGVNGSQFIIAEAE